MANKHLGALDESTTKSIMDAYLKDDKNTLTRHALSRSSLSDVTFVSSSKTNLNNVFSIDLKTMPVCNQKQSGRCWIFAALNILREMIGKKCKIKNFELSQNYISLYDKIEKANFALESIITLCQYSPNQRVYQYILNCPVSDGGQWDMFVNLVLKYGLMPKDAFIETSQSEGTRETDFVVNAYIRKFAFEATALAKEKKLIEVRKLKDKYMEQIYKMFLSAFGVPPKKFDFRYTDEKDKFHCEENYTPMSFFEKYIGKDVLESFQSLINSPTKDKPYKRNYTVDYLGNVIEGRPINHLNVSMSRMKEAIIAQLSDGNPVWFGSDVSFYRDRAGGCWDDNAFDYKTMFGNDLDFDKGGMLDFRHSAMNHAMVITGVDLKDGKPVKWKIENSWGSDNGHAGYYIMSSSWFDKFVYQAVVDRKYLNKVELDAIKKEPIHLDPWDPMGTLAD